MATQDQIAQLQAIDPRYTGDIPHDYIVMLDRARDQSLLGPWRLRPLRWWASWAVEWKPQDLWVGAFWKRTSIGRIRAVDVWICILPCLPIHVWWYRMTPESEGQP